MNTFQRSLRALRHPASLAAIGLLLINDHVLKAAYPSWVTGKLSDFAGLFFFPFLLIAIGSLPARGLGEERAGRWQPRLAFGLTAVWFAAIKLWPAANAAMAGLLGWLLRARVAIALDPTDVMALVVLWPAWGLWRRVAQPEPIRIAARLDWKGLAALALACAATLATSCSPGQRLARVAAVDGEVYAVLEWAYGGDFQIGQLVPRSIGTGFDMEEDPLPESVAARFAEVMTYPRVACDPADTQTCYRIRYTDQLEGSTDGGATWATVWQVPPSRRTYVQHYADQISVCSNASQADGGPFDLAFSVEPDGSALLVAMGGRGLLRRTPDGRWEELAVRGASPVPYTGASVNIIWREVAAAVAAAFLVLVVLTALAWKRTQRGTADQGTMVKAGDWLLPASVVLLLMYVLLGMGPGEAFIPLFFLLAASSVALLIGMDAGWRAIRSTAMRPEQAQLAIVISWLTAVGVVVVPVLVFYLWMVGTIPWYEVAVALAVGAAVGITLVGRRATLEAARLANEYL